LKLCVGAVSRRVVEEAAKLQVHQIVASRRQVDVDGGYTGYDQRELVEVVKKLSDAKTQVIRDHGGPFQGGTNDDGVDSLAFDVAAGFDALHIDVCELPHDDQIDALRALLTRFRYESPIEIGGEHENQDWNNELLDATLHMGIIPSYTVIGCGTYVWADRQCGNLYHPTTFQYLTRHARNYKIPTKVHNFDFVGNRKAYAAKVDTYNIAPEFGMVEVRAILTILGIDDAVDLLHYAYDSDAWRRWFHDDEGTWQERAECAIRYVLEDYEAKRYMQLDERQESYVRRCVRDAITYG
jgi:hypothetical protein